MGQFMKKLIFSLPNRALTFLDFSHIVIKFMTLVVSFESKARTTHTFVKAGVKTCFVVFIAELKHKNQWKQLVVFRVSPKSFVVLY